MDTGGNVIYNSSFPLQILSCEISSVQPILADSSEDQAVYFVIYLI